MSSSGIVSGTPTNKGDAKFTAKISGSHTLSDYAGSIQQVATRSDTILAGLTGYQLTVTASP